MSSTNSKRIAAVRTAVWGYWNKSGRHTLPWRKTRDPYKILVSEMMLQQTQVSRVIEKYKEFLKAFPSVRALARAPLSDVLRVWSGLGYNRRAKYLHDAAREIVGAYKGNFREALRGGLPGVGPYTRPAVEAFAFNEPGVLIETNIRTVFMHHVFPKTKIVSDRALSAMVERAAEKQDPRTWNWALMDYGAYLKQSGVRTNARSAHYTKQPAFKGSLREVRGAILRELHAGRSPETLPFGKQKISRALAGLARDGLITKKKGAWRIA